jgi:hypothetical protein
MKALGAIWPLFYRSKITTWEVHEKLFESIVCSTVLYGAHIWGWNYSDILEKVQSKLIRRLLHVDFKTPTYALRLETDSYKLELKIARLTLNFVIRLLSMDDRRIAKMLFNTLRNTTDGETKRYNWSLNLKELLQKTGFEHLSTTSNSLDLIASKQEILENLKMQLRQVDVFRASSSAHLQYLASLTDGQRITRLFTLGMPKVRILAQIRLNQTQFFWKDSVHTLDAESTCTFCNLREEEDLFHLLIECRIHRESQIRFLSPLQLNTSINRLNLLQNIVNLSEDESRKVALFTVVALNRRKWFNEV